MMRVMKNKVELTFIMILALFCSGSYGKDVVIHPLEQKTFGYYSVMLPPDYNEEASKEKEYPVCLLVHGSGGHERTHVKLVESHLGREGVIYVTARAPFPKNNVFMDKQRAGFTAWPEYSYKKTSSIEVAEEHEVAGRTLEKYYTQWMADCLNDVRARYRTDGKKVVTLGHSQGGAFALRFALDFPEEVSACFASAGYYKEWLDTSEAADTLKAHNIFVFFAHNEDDHAVKFEHGEALHAYLTEHEVPFEHMFFPDGKHKFRNETKARAKVFIDKRCRGLNP